MKSLKEAPSILFKYFACFVKVTSENKGLSRWPLVENVRKLYHNLSPQRPHIMVSQGEGTVGVQGLGLALLPSG